MSEKQKKIELSEVNIKDKISPKLSSYMKNIDISTSNLSIICVNHSNDSFFFNTKSNSISIKKNNYENIIDVGVLKCSECKSRKAVFKCDHCNELFCSQCSDYISNIQVIQNHKLRTITEKELFLLNFIQIMKELVTKINNLLKIENKNIIYPKINDIYNFNLQIQFLKEMNLLNKKYCSFEKSSTFETDNKVIESFEKYLKKDNYKSNGILEIDEKFNLDDKKEFDEKEFNYNKLFLFINVVPKENVLNDKIIDIISDKISSCLAIEKENLFFLYNDKANNFVKSKDFNKLSFIKLKNDNKILNKFCELKKLIELFLNKQCDISMDYFDYRGNFLTPNNSCNLKIGKLKYDPPYGWIGIGLKVFGEYYNDDWLINISNNWAVAYYGLEDIELKFTQSIKNIIINKELNNGKEGKNIRLTPSITNAENIASVFPINDKKYTIVFMAKVHIKGIREEGNNNSWILDSKYIRIYRILFKEITSNYSVN